MNPEIGFGPTIIACVADVIAILSWLKVEPKQLFNSEWTVREIRVTAGKLVLIVIFSLLSLGLSCYGFYEIHANEMAQAVPRIVGWGVANKHCNVVVDTSRIVDAAEKYSVVLACGVNDPTVDVLEDKRIILSGAFGIAGGAQAISAASNPDFDKFVDSLGAGQNTPISCGRKYF